MMHRSHPVTPPVVARRHMRRVVRFAKSYVDRSYRPLQTVPSVSSRQAETLPAPASRRRGVIGAKIAVSLLWNFIVIDHTGIGVASVSRSAPFYDAALGALGMRRVMQLPEKEGTDGVGYGIDYPVFWIDRFHPHGVKQHTAFVARNRGEVDAFHAAALGAGGVDNGPPGLRSIASGYPPGYYAAFVLDPDGNNVEAVCREA